MTKFNIFSKVTMDFKDEKETEKGCISQLSHISFYQACIAEFLGVFLLVLFAVGFGLNASSTDFTNTLTGAIGTGFLVNTTLSDS